MNRLNVDAQSTGAPCAIPGAVTSTPHPATIAVAISATVLRNLERLAGMDTSDGRKGMCVPTFTYRRGFPQRGETACEGILDPLTSTTTRFKTLSGEKPHDLRGSPPRSISRTEARHVAHVRGAQLTNIRRNAETKDALQPVAWESTVPSPRWLLSVTPPGALT